MAKVQQIIKEVETPYIDTNIALITAVISNDTDQIKSLLENGTVVDKDFLNKAAKIDSTALLSALLDTGTDINKPFEGQTLLDIAITNKAWKQADFLLERVTQDQVQSLLKSGYFTQAQMKLLLHYTEVNDKLVILKAILDMKFHGTQINVKNEEDKIEVYEINENTLLYTAIMKSANKQIQLLTDQQVPMIYGDRCKILNKLGLEAYRTLLNKVGLNKNDWSPEEKFTDAFNNGRFISAKRIKNNNKIDDSKLKDLLTETVTSANNNTDKIKFLLENGAVVDKDLLNKAAGNDSTELLRALFKTGTDINEPIVEGQTLLDIAIHKEAWAQVTCLLGIKSFRLDKKHELALIAKAKEDEIIDQMLQMKLQEVMSDDFTKQDDIIAEPLLQGDANNFNDFV